MNISVLTLLVIQLILSSSITQGQDGVGVKPGDWATWELSAHSVTIKSYFTPLEPEVEDISNSTYEMRILAVSGGNVTWSSGPAPHQMGKMNIFSSRPSFAFNLMPADLKVDDRVQRIPFYYPAGQAGLRFDELSFNTTVTGSENRIVLGSIRRLNRIHFEYRYDSIPSNEGFLRKRISVDVLFDADTGLLVESYFFMWSAWLTPGSLAQVNFVDSSRYVLKDTNVWGAESKINPIVYNVFYLLIGITIPIGIFFIKRILRRK